MHASPGETQSLCGPGRGLPADITKDIAGRIKKLRKERKLTQKQWANALGISQAALSKLETGKKLPSLATLLKLREICRFASIEQIFGELPSQTLGSQDNEGFEAAAGGTQRTDQS
jgi:transcriptional regulator with XRE-family HTH domain